MANDAQKVLIFVIEYTVAAKQGCNIDEILDSLSDRGGSAEVVDVRIRKTETGNG
jgi:hypothetical protein